MQNDIFPFSLILFLWGRQEEWKPGTANQYLSGSNCLSVTLKERNSDNSDNQYKPAWPWKDGSYHPITIQWEMLDFMYRVIRQGIRYDAICCSLCMQRFLIEYLHMAKNKVRMKSSSERLIRSVSQMKRA